MHRTARGRCKQNLTNTRVLMYKHTFEESEESWLSPNVENAATNNLRRLVSKWEFSLSWKMCRSSVTHSLELYWRGLFLSFNVPFEQNGVIPPNMDRIQANKACTLLNPFPWRLVTWSGWNVPPLGHRNISGWDASFLTTYGSFIKAMIMSCGLLKGNPKLNYLKMRPLAKILHQVYLDICIDTDLQSLHILQTFVNLV